ncbi:hypothetical protein [Paraburkholderia sp. GAS32]|uniref:hypothetical protein n=1 Tax=Paraburkholderia sp. GAS32 TaxID=3035129 RepID=UPI003D25410A
MNNNTISQVPFVRKSIAGILAWLSPVAGLYTLFLIVPIVRGEDGYVGLTIIRAITNGIVYVTERGIGTGMNAAFGQAPDRFDGFGHTVLYCVDGFAICVLAACVVMASCLAASRALSVGWKGFLREIRTVGFVKAVTH